jgi:transposase
MNLLKVHIGVDISKNNLDVYIYPIGKSFKIANSEPAIKKFIRGLADYDIEQIVCEATGGYEKLFAQLSKENSYSCWIIDPRRIKGFIIASGCKSKTDKIDAQKIAEFSAKNSMDYEAVPKSKNQEQLQAFVNRKNDLTKFLAAEKTRLKHPSHALCLSSIRKVTKALEREIKVIDKQIIKLVSSDAELHEKAKFLESIPGIGRSSAALLLSHVPELGKLSNNKISALIGVCPYNRESGTYKGKGFIRGGRATPRNALYMCALTAIKYHLPLKAFYDRLIANKKPFKVVIVAVMRKIIIIANSILRKGELCKA